MNTENNALRECAEEIVRKWHIRSWLNFKCYAVTDGGIDADENREFHIFELRPENILFTADQKPVGVRFGDFTFYFDNPKTMEQEVIEKNKYVGGWGDVTETRHFKLEKGGR